VICRSDYTDFKFVKSILKIWCYRLDGYLLVKLHRLKFKSEMPDLNACIEVGVVI